MMDGKKVFNQPVSNDLRTYDDIIKTATGQGDDYKTGCLLEYAYFRKYYKMIVIKVIKQQALDVDPKAMPQINFTGNLNQNAYTTMLFIVEMTKATISDFFKEL